MDFLNNLLTTAAGYYGDQQAANAQLKLAQTGLQTQQAATQQAQAAATQAQTQASQWIPGVSNGLVIGAGLGLVALGLIVVLAKK